VHFSDDILMEEIKSMAKAHGFHVRHTNGMTVVDRVPGIVRKDPPATNVVRLPRTKTERKA